MKDFFVGFWNYLKNLVSGTIGSIAVFILFTIIALIIFFESLLGIENSMLVKPSTIDGFRKMADDLEKVRINRLAKEIKKEGETNENSESNS